VGRKEATGPVAADVALLDFAAFVAGGARGREEAVAFIDAGLGLGELSSKPSEDEPPPSEGGGGRLREDAEKAATMGREAGGAAGGASEGAREASLVPPAVGLAMTQRGEGWEVSVLSFRG
jgi:hypothetical protein